MRRFEDTLDNGITFGEYHRDQLAQFTGFEATYKGTNFDKLICYIDDVYFTRMENLDEIAKAREIAYAHGLELDDIGDVLGVTRDGYDDDVYRFLLYSHNLARNSKGTHNDLLRIAARMIGCDPADIVLKPDRHYDSTGQLVGKPRTLNIVDIAYSKVKNLFLLDRLASELERSAVAGTKINFVNLSVPIESNTFVGTDLQVMEKINI